MTVYDTLFLENPAQYTLEKGKQNETSFILDLLFAANNLYSKILMQQFLFCLVNMTKGSFAEAHYGVIFGLKPVEIKTSTAETEG